MEWWQANVPDIKTELPGPRAKSCMQLDEQFTSTSYTRDVPLVVKDARGAVLRDMDDNLFLDFTAGIAVCATGHCHPKVTEAIQRQSEKFLHICTADFYSEPAARLAERLCTLAPGNSPKRIFFCNSGAEANEAAIKLARYTTKRPRFIAFLGAFHGRTMGAMSLTGSKTRQRQGFGPLMPGVIHVPYPNPYRPLLEAKDGDLTGAVLKYIEEVVFRRITVPEEVAAVFVEPIQGEGGYVAPPEDFFPRLREFTEKYGILMVVDEVQSGMGRTGKLFATEYSGVEPDIITLSKGIASGLPLGAMIARADLMTWQPGAHANTLGGNPVSCAASLATLDLLQSELMENASGMGAYLIEKLKGLKSRFSVIGDVRGKGLMVGMELIEDPASRKPAAELRDRITQSCFRKGLLILGCGESAIRFCPPLIINQEQIDSAVEILAAVVEEQSDKH